MAQIRNGVVIPADLPEFSEEGRNRAAYESQGCELCGGVGLVVIDHAVEARTASATCSCLHGRWIQAWHSSKGSRAITDRLYEIANVIGGRHRFWRFETD